MDISARLELDVDFAEEEADPDYATWGAKLEAIRESVESILKSFKGKAAVSRLPLAVLYGAPNAGKSSLVNALLGEDRILVSNIPGTTRDFVEVRLFLDGGEIRLVDTAGIADQATDALDALSMEKSREILAEADMKILVVDQVSGVRYQESGMDESPDVVVYSKSDLAQCHPESPMVVGTKKPTLKTVFQNHMTLTPHMDTMPRHYPSKTSISGTAVTQWLQPHSTKN